MGRDRYVQRIECDPGGWINHPAVAITWSRQNSAEAGSSEWTTDFLYLRFRHDMASRIRGAWNFGYGHLLARLSLNLKANQPDTSVGFASGFAFSSGFDRFYVQSRPSTTMGGWPCNNQLAYSLRRAMLLRRKYLSRPLRRVRDIFLYRRFLRIKKRARGMLAAQVYAELYKIGCMAPDLDIIEVGAGGGAGSVSLALALIETDKSSHLITIEKCEGGSRLKFGGRDENLLWLEQIFDEFKVADRIKIFPEGLSLENGHKVQDLIETGQISCLIHDADGRVDRDFILFFPLLTDGGYVIIDDFVEKSDFKPISEEFPFGGTKELMTYRIVHQLLSWKLIEVDKILDNTLFARKRAGARVDVIDQARISEILESVKIDYEMWQRSKLG